MARKFCSFYDSTGLVEGEIIGVGGDKSEDAFLVIEVDGRYVARGIDWVYPVKKLSKKRK